MVWGRFWGVSGILWSLPALLIRRSRVFVCREPVVRYRSQHPESAPPRSCSGRGALLVPAAGLRRREVASAEALRRGGRARGGARVGSKSRCPLPAGAAEAATSTSRNPRVAPFMGQIAPQTLPQRHPGGCLPRRTALLGRGLCPGAGQPCTAAARLRARLWAEVAGGILRHHHGALEIASAGGAWRAPGVGWRWQCAWLGASLSPNAGCGYGKTLKRPELGPPDRHPAVEGKISGGRGGMLLSSEPALPALGGDVSSMP